MPQTFRVIVIGGSAGSLLVLNQIINELPEQLPIPVIIVLHRLKNVVSEMSKLLSIQTHKHIIEPDDKSPIREHCIYLAPQNYHLLIERDYTFSLDYSETIQYSRPSIDATLESASNVYKESLLAILLSGANRDGSNGISQTITNGGYAIVQEPASALYPVMPESAIARNPAAHVLQPAQIIDTLHSLFK